MSGEQKPVLTLGERVLSDGRWIVVYPLTYGRARLTISAFVDVPVYDDGW